MCIDSDDTIEDVDDDCDIDPKGYMPMLQMEMQEGTNLLTY